MQYKFTLLQDCLRAELVGRESVAETQEFIRLATEEVVKHRCPRILVWVRRSRPIFKVEQYRISEHFKQIAANPQVRVALLADTEEKIITVAYDSIVSLGPAVLFPFRARSSPRVRAHLLARCNPSAKS